MKLSSRSLLPKQIIEALDNWAIYRIWLDILMSKPKRSGFFLTLRMLPYGLYFHGILKDWGRGGGGLKKTSEWKEGWINLWGYFNQNCKVYWVVTTNFFQQEHITLRLQQGEKLQLVGFRGRGVRNTTVRSNRRLYQWRTPSFKGRPRSQHPLPRPASGCRAYTRRIRSR